ncbi:MAG: DUF1697 domain-containing protein [Bacteroidales bacterium]|nr:DUF1697 domain-containing protein [Bacteroidales bacterium]
MNSYISLLKGVNVGGNRKLNMKEVKSAYELFGLKDVKTVLQSGNILFKSDVNDTAVLENKIRIQLNKTFGIDTDILVLTKETLQQIIDKCPWKDFSNMNTSHVFILFLFQKPQNIDKALIESKRKSNEELHYTDNAVFMHCPDGMADSKLTTTLFEKALGAKNTARNWNTAGKILSLI